MPTCTGCIRISPPFLCFGRYCIVYWLLVASLNPPTELWLPSTLILIQLINLSAIAIDWYKLNFLSQIFTDDDSISFCLPLEKILYDLLAMM